MNEKLRAGGAKLQTRPCPPLRRRVGEALFVMAMGRTYAEGRHDLMWPYAPDAYTADDVLRAAARLVASVHTAVLEALPPVRTERISTDLDAYLSFVHGDGWPDDNSPSPADTAPPLV